jgi:hypothetical protein
MIRKRAQMPGTLGACAAIAVALMGCGTRDITVDEFSPRINVDTLDHCVYLGSDDRYHYFAHCIGLVRHRYRIPIETLVLDNTAQYPIREPRLVTREEIKAAKAEGE